MFGTNVYLNSLKISSMGKFYTFNRSLRRFLKKGKKLKVIVIFQIISKISNRTKQEKTKERKPVC